MPARALLRYLAPHRGRYALGFALLLATNLSALMIPWTVKTTIEALGDASHPTGPAGGVAHRVAAGALLVIGLAVLQGIARAASRLLLLGAGQRVEAQIRSDLFARLLRLPPAFYQSRRTGDLMSRATNDLSGVAMLIGFGLLSLANTVIVYVGTLAAMLRIDPRLTLAALLPYPLLVLIAKGLNARVHAAYLAVQEQLGRLSTKVQENLTGMAVVHAYTMEAHEIATFRRLNAEYRVRTIALARTQGVFSPLMGIMGGIGALTVLWVGGKGVIDGRITLGAFVAFSSYLAFLAWPTVALGWVLAIVRRGFTAMERILEILEAAPAVETPPAAGPAPVPIRGEIELRHLTFAYDTAPGVGAKGPRREPALRDVSLRIPAGACVAIVGATGAGKSTLASLLPRLWDPPPGSIFIDGRDVGSIPLSELRGAIAVVPQDAFLFSRPLAENVLLGGDEGRLEWAGRVAGLSADAARLPGGWSTVVGERGLTLSGGQRQRATLARALVRDPRILVLDDAFAAVDAAKEAEILDHLRDAMAGRTAILITHRLRAARAADWIVVLDAGRIVEQGSHESLLQAGGVYARQWRRQQLESRLEAAS